ncbi:hypothetical protein [Neobacillus sp. FSL H8-0543]|uniref:hypothetical protein n=1 Tax=Neobacillus sp. FSL H8-0543 TaxID=2954672 RepID=UPI003158C2D8
MKKEVEEESNQSSTNNNKNRVRVNNNFQLTINLGDSLNLLALIAGIYVIKNFTKKRKAKKANM